MKIVKVLDQLDENIIRHDSGIGKKGYHIEYECALYWDYEKCILDGDVFQYVHNILTPIKTKCANNDEYGRWMNGVICNVHEQMLVNDIFILFILLCDKNEIYDRGRLWFHIWRIGLISIQ